MVVKDFVLKSENGLHARPAGVLAKKASEFQSSVELECSGTTKNAKSIMALMTMGIKSNTPFKLKVSGTDENEAIEQLTHFLQTQGLIQ